MRRNMYNWSIAEDAQESSNRRSCRMNASHWPDAESSRREELFFLKQRVGYKERKGAISAVTDCTYRFAARAAAVGVRRDRRCKASPRGARRARPPRAAARVRLAPPGATHGGTGGAARTCHAPSTARPPTADAVGLIVCSHANAQFWNKALEKACGPSGWSRKGRFRPQQFPLRKSATSGWSTVVPIQCVSRCGARPSPCLRLVAAVLRLARPVVARSSDGGSLARGRSCRSRRRRAQSPRSQQAMKMANNRHTGADPVDIGGPSDQEIRLGRQGESGSVRLWTTGVFLCPSLWVTLQNVSHQLLSPRPLFLHSCCTKRRPCGGPEGGGFRAIHKQNA